MKAKFLPRRKKNIQNGRNEGVVNIAKTYSETLPVKKMDFACNVETEEAKTSEGHYRTREQAFECAMDRTVRDPGRTTRMTAEEAPETISQDSHVCLRTDGRIG